MRYRNTSGTARVWPALTDPATGATLALDAGGTVNLDPPEDFHDPYLTPDRPAAHKTTKTDKTDPDDDVKD